MKRISRMFLFSAVAIFINSYWNKGFIISSDPMIFMKATIAVAIAFYFIIPLSKLILLPLNILTLGLMSFIVGLLILNILNINLSLISIKEWNFPGFSLVGFTIEKFHINYIGNLALSSFSISFIINLLESLL